MFEDIIEGIDDIIQDINDDESLDDSWDAGNGPWTTGQKNDVWNTGGCADCHADGKDPSDKDCEDCDIDQDCKGCDGGDTAPDFNISPISPLDGERKRIIIKLG